jgi:hypothetical protein
VHGSCVRLVIHILFPRRSLGPEPLHSCNHLFCCSLHIKAGGDAAQWRNNLSVTLQVAGSGSCMHPQVDIHMVSRDLLICSFIVPPHFSAQLVEITFKLITLHHHPPPSIPSLHNQKGAPSEEIVTSAFDTCGSLTAAVYAYSLSLLPLPTMLQQRCGGSGGGSSSSSGGGINKLLVASYNILAQCYANPEKFCAPQSAAAAASDALLPPSSPSSSPCPSFLQLPLLALNFPHTTHPLLLSASFRHPRLYADVYALLTVISIAFVVVTIVAFVAAVWMPIVLVKLFACSPHLTVEFHDISTFRCSRMLWLCCKRSRHHLPVAIYVLLLPPLLLPQPTAASVLFSLRKKVLHAG